MRLIVLFSVSFLLLIILAFCSAFMDTSSKKYKITAVVFVVIIIVSVSSVWMFLAYAKPVAAKYDVYRLKDFTKCKNGYIFSYYDHDENLIGGFVRGETVEASYYEEEPSVRVGVYSGRKEFLFLYDTMSEPETSYVFYVLQMKDMEFK